MNGLRVWISMWVISVTPILAEDWPQWLGVQRDSVWREEGIAKKFPEGGPKVLWRVPVKVGYSGPAVAKGRVYLMDYEFSEGEISNSPGGRVPLKGEERVLCLDAGSGEKIWEYIYESNYDVSYPSGPRCTPTVDGDRVFTLGTMGQLACLDAMTGEVSWTSDFRKAYGAKVPHWGNAAHPLVYKGMVICMVGGEGSLVVAFDRETGKERWRSLTAEHCGYCPPQIIDHAGVEQLIVWHPAGLSSLNPMDGTEYWTLPLKATGGASVVAPRLLGNRLFASAYNKIGALIELDPKKPAGKILWRGKPKNAVYCVNSTPFLMGDYIYGVDVDASALMAVALEDGTRKWTTTEPVLAPEAPPRSRHGTAFIVYHPGNEQFWIANESGELIIAELSPEGYKEVSRAGILKPTGEVWGRKVVWSHPAFAMKSVFMRNDKELVRVAAF